MTKRTDKYVAALERIVDIYTRLGPERIKQRSHFCSKDRRFYFACVVAKHLESLIVGDEETEVGNDQV